MNQEHAVLVDVLVVATREVSDQPQPGIIEVMVFDVDKKIWHFIDKYPIFGVEYGNFPSAGLMRCQVLRIDSPKKQVLISTTTPYQIYDHHNQRAEFWVYESQLIAITQTIDFSELKVNHALH